MTDSKNIKAVAAGFSLSITWVMFYTLCSFVYLISPNLVLSATRDLFHGMSFGQLAEHGSVFTFTSYLNALGLGIIYTFLVGYIYSAVDSFIEARLKYLAAHSDNVSNKHKAKSQAR